MNSDKEVAVRVCDICGEVYEGVQYGLYRENLCDPCLEKTTGCSLPLITADVDESAIPCSVFDEFENGRDVYED